MPAIWAGVSAVSSIAGGIFGASAARSSNKRERKREKKQRKAAKNQARITNRYNRAAYLAEVKDYFSAREFQYQTAVKQWQYDTAMQDYRYLQDAKAYEASVENYGQQLLYNNVAYQAAKESNQASFNELLAGAAVEAQSSLVQNLEAEGSASLGQAGVSQAKTMQAIAAKQGRDLAVLRASVLSGEKEYLRGMTDLALQKYGADMQAKSQLMIRPERLPELIKPERGPARTFVAPAPVMPGAVPPARYTNPMMPLIGGITAAANAALTAGAR